MERLPYLAVFTKSILNVVFVRVTSQAADVDLGSEKSLTNTEICSDYGSACGCGSVPKSSVTFRMEKKIIFSYFFFFLFFFLFLNKKI